MGDTEPGTLWTSSFSEAWSDQGQAPQDLPPHLAMICLRLAFKIISISYSVLPWPHQLSQLKIPFQWCPRAWNALCFSPGPWELVTCSASHGAKAFSACFGSEASLWSSKLVWSFIVFFPLGFNYGCLKYFMSEVILIAVTTKQWK